MNTYEVTGLACNLKFVLQNLTALAFDDLPVRLPVTQPERLLASTREHVLLASTGSIPQKELFDSWQKKLFRLRSLSMLALDAHLT